MSNLISKQVDFNGDTLLAIKEEDTGKIYVAVKHICDALGLNENQRRNQYLKTQEDIVISRGVKKFSLPTNGGLQETYCIELDFLPLWLAKINVNIIPNEQVQEKLVEYQLRAKDVLAAAFLPQQKPVTVLDALTQTVQVLKEQDARLRQLESTTQAIKDTIIQEPDNWREDMNRMFNKIVDRIGGQKFQEVRNESYRLLEKRAHVDLTRRLMNLRTRMLDQGATKTAIEKANKLDVIEQDPKLREIYAQIIKEYYIRYVA
ncbi:phage antirepressor N-terminal domain-containing protein [Thermoclostridium stercorarium]|uniref:phage antirepressor N-terminal domain-containing protein n=1 Tax=Thermoclostridium stercorarium TaxID=1510 RepID=UPI0022489F73|nr:phage antirepressor N-terminal domain-containing protein [Thermoclostridium stercorarium]UZQ86002.1 phage antirepressor N-terminal domain-containing protein [Thermoclostridium stercorarium]